ncbi:SDR family oxidoreductase [Nocardia vinacea]|uniref:SDR family oxidoreductase n=1 Tax=Nocardia vinacea TaxID=96468 RepID=A0ABZ1YNH4_9NOCA|nr:SDR family oxidoreductase [Nocardia vinacea]
MNVGQPVTLDDHVVLVTGGGSGLGLGLTRYFTDIGAQVIVLEYDVNKVKALQAEFGDRVLAVVGDVRSVADLQHCRDVIVERFGRLSAVVGTQGISDGVVRVEDMTAEHIDALFDEVFGVNVKGYMLTAKVFLELLRADRGAIVLTASQAAYAADGGGIVYTASKGAVTSLVNQLSFEFAPEIRVNAVAPTGIGKSELRGPETLHLQDSKQSDSADVFREQFEWLAPMQHLPDPEEYGPLYAFLASRQNQIMTGQTVIADQGALNRALISMGDLIKRMPKA